MPTRTVKMRGVGSMALVETVVVGIGAAIAKGILKLWLKEQPIAGEVGDSLIGLLQTHTNSQLALLDGQRAFTNIGQRVARSLLPLFEAEGDRLDEGGRNSVAIEVASALQRANVTPTHLARRNLDPAILANEIVANHPLPRNQFGEAEISFYQRMIGECCQAMVDVASRLPGFDEATFAEVLQREDVLLERTSLVLREVQRVRELAERANPEVRAARFEADYRREVERSLDVLELFGLDVDESSQRHPLTVAYIPLSVQGEVCTRAAGEPTPENVELLVRSNSERPAPTARIEALLAANTRVLIRGVAGSGKTTLLQWIAVRSATGTFPEALRDWNGSLPFFVRLRRLTARDLPRPEELPGLVAPNIAARMPGEWAHEQLEGGRAVVLVDGVDEIPEARHREVHDWLSSLIEFYGDCRFVVTGRTHVRQDWLEELGFGSVEVLPMGSDDISAFIESWHRAVCRDATGTPKQDEIESLAPPLKDRIRREASLRRLATNPLLCAMICALHRARRGYVPPNRVELYERCVEALVHRREEERQLTARGYVPLDYPQKLAILKDLALWSVINRQASAATEDALEHVGTVLPAIQGLPPDATPENVFRLLLERSGVIREPIAGQVDFIHRTFQEFLAAWGIVDKGYTQILIDRANEPDSHELIALAVGRAGRRVTDDILRKLIRRGDRGSKIRYPLHLVAAACLETAVEISPEVREQVLDRFRKLVPPMTPDAARALSRAGELSVPHLGPWDGQDEETARACVDSLMRLRGDAALDVLAAYATHGSEGLQVALMWGMEAFDEEEFLRRVLAHCEETKLFVFRPEHLRLLHLLVRCRELTLYDYNAASGRSTITSFIGFQPPANLSRLALRHFVSLTDLSGIERASALRGIELVLSPWLTDLSPLMALHRLEELQLTSIAGSVDLRPLCKIPRLTKLKISTTIDNLENVGSLQSVDSLDLFVGHPVTPAALRFLTTWPSLQSLALWHTDINDVETLHEFLPGIDITVKHPLLS
jgi:hypothetical protein